MGCELKLQLFGGKAEVDTVENVWVESTFSE